MACDGRLSVAQSRLAEAATRGCPVACLLTGLDASHPSMTTKTMKAAVACFRSVIDARPP